MRAQPPGFRKHYWLIALLAALLALILWGMRLQLPFLSSFEGQLVDVQTRLRGPLKPAVPVSILMIDDRSLGEIGTIPIDRRLIAQAVRQLHADGARLVVFDMLFVERANKDPAADQALATALDEAGNVVLPYAFSGEAERDGASGEATPIPDKILDSAYTSYFNEAKRRYIPFQPHRMLMPLPQLAQAARGLGHVSALPDRDGALRYDFPALWYEGELFPSMALRVAQLVTGASLKANLGQSVELGPLKLPLDAASRQWVNYYGPSHTFDTHVFADLIAGRLPPGLFKDRIVLIGDTALGNSDRHASAFDPALPGVERIATVLDNVLSQRWLSRPRWAASLEIGLMLILPVCAVALIATLPAGSALAAAGGLLLALAGAVQWLFARYGLVLSAGFPMLALLLGTLLATGVRAWEDELMRRSAERALRASEARYALAARGANDGLWDWNLVSGEVFYSERWRQLMGVEPDAPIHTMDDWTGQLDQIERQRFQSELDAHLEGRSGQFYHVFRHDSGHNVRWFLARGLAVSEDGRLARMAGSLTDITEQKQLEKQIAFDAWHDRLTGLANRDLFNDRLQQWFAAGGAMPIGLVLLDIDNFRHINEQYGQLAGNDLLGEVARRLQSVGDEQCLVARVGSDQFALAFHGGEDSEILARVEQVFEQPFTFNEQTQRVRSSMAWAHTAQGLESAEELQNAAALALAHAKGAARGQLRRFNPDEQAQEKSRRWLHDNIDKALAAGDQFKLYYQPFVRLSDRRLVGFEALIRWEHPEKGFIFPNDFIPYAEESGQINAIGRWTLFQAARDMISWESIGFDGEVAVNLSGRQFSDMDLIAECQALIQALGPVSPHRYKLEVTESMAMANPQQATDTLTALAALGFKISIDDFGTGYSSLAYLHRFPFDTLKVDRSFVIRLDSGVEAREIVRTIAGLGRSLGKQVLAEGVEEENQARVLESLGVQIGQGWLFAKALPYVQATAAIVRDRQVQPGASSTSS